METDVDTDIVDDEESTVELDGVSVSSRAPSPADSQASTVIDDDTNIVDEEASTVELDGASVNSTVPSPADNQAGTLTFDIEKEDLSKKRKLGDEDEDADDGKICPICLDNWTNTGEHRIVALKCGHLFGLKCLNRWLESLTKKSCPTCKKRVVKHDIRYIYAKKLIAMDTSELDALKKQIGILMEEKSKVQLDLTRSVCREFALNEQIKLLKKEVADLKSINRTFSSGQPMNKSIQSSKDLVRLYMDKSLELCRASGCRVFDIQVQKDLIVASLKSPSNLFTGYGIRKVNLSNYKPTTFIPLHTLPIRDLVIHPQKDLILTASVDKSFKVVDLISNNVSFNVLAECPLWSACWDSSDLNMFYVGTQQGTVHKYDMRQTAQPVHVFSVVGDMSPVVSIASLRSAPGEAISRGGIMCCKLMSIYAFEATGVDYERYHLPLDGPFVCMRYQSNMRQFLVSSRPNSRISHVRHSLCTLSKNADGAPKCDVVHCFNGGGVLNFLSRTAFVSNGDGNDFIAAHHEASKSVCLWNINTGNKAGSVPAHDLVLDTCGVHTNAGGLLACLTDKKLELFKFSNS